MTRNVIEPWRAPSPSIFDRGERIGTKVVYEGTTLRARGDYSDDVARALISSLRHAEAEGITV